jgi:hypothetical protein
VAEVNKCLLNDLFFSSLFMSQIQGEEQIGHLGSNEKGQFQKDRRTISEGYNLINRAKL